MHKVLVLVPVGYTSTGTGAGMATVHRTSTVLSTDLVLYEYGSTYSEAYLDAR